MKSVEKQFFSLLRAGLWDLDVDTSLFEEPIDWQTILEMGRKQTVLGVLADGIAKLPSESRPSKKRYAVVAKSDIQNKEKPSVAEPNVEGGDGTVTGPGNPSGSAERARCCPVVPLSGATAVWGY